MSDIGWPEAIAALESVRARFFSGRMEFKRALGKRINDRFGFAVAPEEWLLVATPEDIVGATQDGRRPPPDLSWALERGETKP